MYICRDHRLHRGLGLDESEFTKSVLSFIFYFIRPYIASENNVVVTVLHLLQVLHRRIIVYRILSEIQKLMAHTSEYHCHGTSNLTT